MSSRIPMMPDTLEWKRAYVAAIIETDRTRFAKLTDTARLELLKRERALFCGGPSVREELDAINDAIYLLQVLQASRISSRVHEY